MFSLTPQKENQVEKYLEVLKFSVSNKLQNENTTMENGSILFSGLCMKFASKYPNFNNYLHSDSNIVFLPHFELGIVEVMSRESLTQMQEAAVRVFEQSDISSFVEENTLTLPWSFCEIQ